MDIQTFYYAMGEDWNVILRRFGSQALVEKYLKKLPADPTFTALEQAMEEDNGQQAFRAAHTLKGIALNLGLSALTDCSSSLAEALRGQDQIAPQAHALFPQTRQAYLSAVEQIRQLQS